VELDRALKAFMSKRVRKYSQSDLELIIDAVKALNLSDEFIVSKDYVTDPHHQIHIHPTLIVAARKFPGSIDRGLEPYSVHRFFKGLSAWRKTSVR
jgi:hypothetical protein